MKPRPWRPLQQVRSLAVGLVRRGDQFLMMTVTRDDGTVVGYRPVGGEIEFGERSEAALRREFMEELSQELTHPRLVTVLENLFQHHGAQGHEIVFVFEAEFADPSAHAMDHIWIEEGGGAEILWIPREDLVTGGLILPTALSAYL